MSFHPRPSLAEFHLAGLTTATGAARALSPVELPPEPEAERSPRRWNLESLSGGITEISGPVPAAGLTAAARLVREAQERGEPAAWIAAGDSIFYAPDLHDWGVDLAAFPVVRVPGALAAARAAESLLRSGAFALLVIDLGRVGPGGGAGGGRDLDRDRDLSVKPVRRPGSSAHTPTLPSPAQVRLAALCRRHESVLLLLAQKPEGTPPVTSMVLLRAEGSLHRAGFDRFAFELRVVKDKRQGAGWIHEEEFRAPEGLG